MQNLHISQRLMNLSIKLLKACMADGGASLKENYLLTKQEDKTPFQTNNDDLQGL